MAEDAKRGLTLFELKLTVKELLVLATVVGALVSGYINLIRHMERLQAQYETQVAVTANQIDEFKEFRREVRQELRDLKQ